MMENTEQKPKVENPGEFLRDIVFGANDGVVTAIGFLVGFSGTVADQKVIVIAGTLGIVAGAASMALGNYLAVKSQQEYHSAKERDIGASPIISGVIIGICYILGGIPPLLPFIFLTPVTRALILSLIIAVSVMGTIGFIRWLLHKEKLGSKVVETVLVGIVAALIGYGAGEALRFFGYTVNGGI